MNVALYRETILVNVYRSTLLQTNKQKKKKNTATATNCFFPSKL